MMDIRKFSRLNEQQRTELKGRAQLGEVTSTLIRLKESKQFKVRKALFDLIPVSMGLIL